MFHTHRDYTRKEKAFLDRGAEYLIAHRLFRSIGGGGKVICEDWLRLCFPRFYEYDALRGASFLVQWALLLDRELPLKAVIEILDLLYKTFPEAVISPQRLASVDKTTLVTDANGRWSGEKSVPSSTFSLLQAASRLGQESPALTALWKRTLEGLKTLRDTGRLLVDRPEEFAAWTAH